MVISTINAFIADWLLSLLWDYRPQFQYKKDYFSQSSMQNSKMIPNDPYLVTMLSLPWLADLT